MKRITRRMQELGQRAEQLREIVNQMPGRVEGVDIGDIQHPKQATAV